MAPLPSNLLPPHFWAIVDKAMQSPTTNQAMVIVARDPRGVPCLISVDSPKCMLTLLKLHTTSLQINCSRRSIPRQWTQPAFTQMSEDRRGCRSSIAVNFGHCPCSQLSNDLHKKCDIFNNTLSHGKGFAS